MTDPLLSELCSLCHSQPHKYRCPRCSCRTCSLSCCLRHKKWAHCNGIRDPAVYIKRSDLATPSGIDHDYNYLTSIERQLDNAERDASERGFLLHDADDTIPAWRHDGLDGPRKGEASTKTAIERCGVIIERAPGWLDRRKQNATHWDKRKHHLIWTIEWIHNDGRKTIGRCAENAPLLDAYTVHCESLVPKTNHLHGDEPLSKKYRKRKMGKKAANLVTNLQAHDNISEEVPQEVNTQDDKDTTTAVALDGSVTYVRAIDLVPKHEAPDLEAQVVNKLHSNSTLSEVTDTAGGPHEANPPLVGDQTQQANGVPSKRPHHSMNEVDGRESPARPLHFYLEAPRLPSTQPVLLPLLPDSRLSACLRNNLVLEFPTIYVLEYAESDLPDQYISEERFNARMQQESFRDSIIAKLTGKEEGEIEQDVKQEEDVDAKKLEEVLKRDLKAVF